MAQTPSLIIDISPAGSIKIEAKCFSGSKCAEATEQIELVLGGAGQRKKTKKPEYYAPASSTKATTKLTF